MAGKLAWALSIDGIPAALNGLRELDRTIMSITAHMSQLSNIMGRLGGSGGLGGMPGVPVYRGGPGGGGILGLAGLAGLAGKRGGDTTSVTYNNYGAPKEYNVLQDYGNFMLGRRRANTAKIAAGMHRRGTFGDPLAEAKEVTQRSFDEKMLAAFSAQAAWPYLDAQWAKSHQAMGFPLATVPWQRPGQKGWPFSSSNGGGGGQEGGSLFSNPWGRMSGYLFGKQGLSGFMKSQFGGFGGGGGGDKGFLGNLGEGGFFKALGIGAVAMLALHKAAMLLKTAFEHMAEVYREGARLYQSSARTGVNASTLYTAQRALGAAGIDPETAAHLALSGQFGHGRRVDVAGLTLAAHRIGDQGSLQQIQNMRGTIGDIANSPFAQLGARRAEEAVPAFQKIYELSHEIGAEWKSFEMSIGNLLAPAVKLVGVELRTMLQSINLIVAGLEKLGKLVPGGLLSLLPYGMGLPFAIGSMIPNAPDAKFKRAFAGGSQMNGPISPWERMGFQFSGAAGGTDYARQIAENTKKLADTVTGRNSGTQSRVPFTNFVPQGTP